MLGPYQAAGAFVMRTWAERNQADVLERYLAAYVEALRFVRDPGNRAEAVAILVDKLKLSAEGGGAHLRAADRSRASASRRTPRSTARASRTCWRCAPRSSASRATAVPPPERYVDLGYYERAMKLVGGSAGSDHFGKSDAVIPPLGATPAVARNAPEAAHRASLTPRPRGPISGQRLALAY